jgi:hypothetical protein
MKNQIRPGSALQEFRDYLEFLKGLWAALGSASVLFPLSNGLAGVIPIGLWPDGGFVAFPKSLITTVTTFICLFLVLWHFGRRRQYQSIAKLNAMVTQAAFSIAISLVFLIIYLAAHFAVSQGVYFNVLGWESDDLRRIFGDAILLLLYANFFGFATRAFLLLALREFLGQKLDGKM